MALGLAVVPRRLGGCVMGGSALATAVVLRGSGVAGIGAGAVTSLAMTGPLLDLALRGARGGWRLYLGFVLAGLGSNLVAFAIRAAVGGGRPGAEWLPLASVTYPLCGLLAGLVSALVWFHFRRRPAPDVERAKA